MRSIVDIVTPAKSELLTTLERVKAELQITTAANDEILEAKIAEASSDIQAALGKRLPQEDVKETFWHDDDRHPLHAAHFGKPAQTTLFLNRTPVSAIASVMVDDIILNPSEYRLDPDAGLLDRLSTDGIPCAWRFRKSVIVAYTVASSCRARTAAISPTRSRARWSRWCRIIGQAAAAIRRCDRSPFPASSTGSSGSARSAIPACCRRGCWPRSRHFAGRLSP
jgi:hypothetical protein